MRTKSGTQRLLRWIGNGLLVVMLIWTLVPIYWMVATSLKKDKEIYGFEATLVPRHPTLDAYRLLFAKTPFVKYVKNSVIVAVATTAASLVLGCLGAYALARLRFRGRRTIASGLVFTYLVPPSLLFIPLFAVMSTIIRYAAQEFPVGQLVFCRSAFGIIPVVLIYAMRRELKSIL